MATTDNVANSLNINHAAAARFPRLARLRTPQQFKQTFSQGCRIGAALFRLHVHFATLPQDQSPPIRRDRDDAGGPRLGISVSRRVDARAVGRNRIKRLARESFRGVRDRLPVGDYVLLALRECADADNAQITQALAALWSRAIAQGASESTAPALMRGPAAITMAPCETPVADPGRPPESP